MEGSFSFPFSLSLFFLIHNNTNFLKTIQDLGKSSNDLLGKDYHFSGTSLEVKTATASDVSFKVDGNRDSKSSFVAGNMEGKYTNKYHGLTLTQAWSTSNVLRTQVELENQIAKGLKIDTTTTLNPDKNSKSVILAAAFKQPGLHTRANLDVFNVRTLPFIFSSPPTDLRPLFPHSIGPHFDHRRRGGPRWLPRWCGSLVQCH